MKKLLLSSVCSIATFALGAQTTIPNSGFETWNNMGSYENPDGWGTMNNTTALAGVYTATKGTPGSPGASYLKLTSKTVGPGVVNGVAVSGKLDSTTMLPVSGFPFTLRPQNFTGKWQHMIYGSSQGSLAVTLTRWDATANQRVTVATANQTLSGMAMSWANFSLPFVYADGGYPDTCIIILQASGSAPTNNDYLWVDNLAFTGSVVGINEPSSISGLTVFPNPVKGNLSVQLNAKTNLNAVIELCDLAGKALMRKETGTISGETMESLDVSELKAGIYSLRVTCEDGVLVRKIIVN